MDFEFVINKIKLNKRKYLFILMYIGEVIVKI